MIVVRHEKPEDVESIRRVNEAAFETSDEADLVDALRDDGGHVLSLVAVDGEQIVGHILFSPVVIESESSRLAALGLGPMSVLPAYQRQGIGSRLVEAGLEECASGGHPAVVVLGHADYYPRFGFVPSVEYDITSEYDVPPEVFMVRELRPGVLASHRGVAKYHSEFNKV